MEKNIIGDKMIKVIKAGTYKAQTIEEVKQLLRMPIE